jgi:hypothetical protein
MIHLPQRTAVHLPLPARPAKTVQGNKINVAEPPSIQSLQKTHLLPYQAYPGPCSWGVAPYRYLYGTVLRTARESAHQRARAQQPRRKRTIEVNLPYHQAALARQNKFPAFADQRPAVPSFRGRVELQARHGTRESPSARAFRRRLPNAAMCSAESGYTVALVSIIQNRDHNDMNCSFHNLRHVVETITVALPHVRVKEIPIESCTRSARVRETSRSLIIYLTNTSRTSTGHRCTNGQGSGVTATLVCGSNTRES